MNQYCTQRALYTPPHLSSPLKLKHLCPWGLSVPALSSWLHPSPSCNHSSLSPSLRASPLLHSSDPESQSLLLRLGVTPAAVECFDAVGSWGGREGADIWGVVPFTPGTANVLLFVEAPQLLLFGTIWCSFRGESALKTIAHTRIPECMQYQFYLNFMLYAQDCGERSHYQIFHITPTEIKEHNWPLRRGLCLRFYCWCTRDSFGYLMLEVVTASCDWRQIKWRKLWKTFQHAND